MRVDTTIQAGYDALYSDRMTEWRELGGRYKAENILSVCQGYEFGRVLECGAGEGSILKHLGASNHFKDFYAVEISDSGIVQIEKRRLEKLREVKKFDGYAIPYPDRFFDLVYCSHVIEHVEHPRLLLRELKRVSTWQVFEVPLDYSIAVDKNVGHFLSYGHINVFTPSTFKFLIKTEGYEVIRERLTRSTNDLLRFSWQLNPGTRPFLGELRLALRPLTTRLRRLQMGEQRYNETTFSAYTCLAKGTGELRIL